MNPHLLTILWGMVWRLEWDWRSHPWAYLLTDEDMGNLSRVLDAWGGHEEGSGGWVLDGLASLAGVSAPPPFRLVARRTNTAVESILLWTKENHSPLSVIPHPFVYDSNKFRANIGKDRLGRIACLGYGRMVTTLAYRRAETLARHNDGVLPHVGIEKCVTSARPYMERQGDRWTRPLPGAKRRRAA